MRQAGGAAATHAAAHPAEVRVWDPLVRIFHWSLVAAFATVWLSAEESGHIHRLAGYVVLGLVGFRLVWGVIGSRHARFADFVRGPGAVLRYVRQMRRGRPARHLGHNPAGGAMVVALLTLLAVISGTGTMLTTDTFWGVEWVEGLHAASANLALVLVPLHVLGVVISSLLERENLVLAMITGRKRA
jgi:cytochrome b